MSKLTSNTNEVMKVNTKTNNINSTTCNTTVTINNNSNINHTSPKTNTFSQDKSTQLFKKLKSTKQNTLQYFNYIRTKIKSQHNRNNIKINDYYIQPIIQLQHDVKENTCVGDKLTKLKVNNLRIFYINVHGFRFR